MSIINIYSKNGEIRYTTDDSRKESIRSQQLMGDNYVGIVFDLDRYIQFKSGDYITYKGIKYTLILDYRPERANDVCYHYELKFEGLEGYLKTIPFFHYITIDGKTEKEPEFDYTATLPMFAEMVVNMLHTATGDNSWSVGIAEGYDAQVVSFSATNFFDAMSSIADVFKTEWWLSGKKINFSRCETGNLQTFKLGESLASIDISQSNEVIPNRIYAYGNTRNITPKYTADGIAYNKRLRLPIGVEYVDVTGGAENTIALTVFFDNDEIGDVYPRYTGTISSVEIKGAEEIPIYYIQDKELDFDPEDYLIEGTSLMIKFESGMLMGRDFEATWHRDTKQFEIINTQEGDVQIPFGNIIPKAGDEYIPWNMEMPESYITAAEQELLHVAQEYVDKLNAKTPEIPCRSFEPYFAEYGKIIELGSRVKIEDPRLKDGYIQSRVTKYSYPLYCDSRIEFTLAENISAGRLTQIENKIEDVTADNAKNIQKTMAVSRRAYRDAVEFANAFNAIRLEMALVTTPEGQYSSSCIIQTNKNNDPNLVAISSGELQHSVYLGATDGKWTIEGSQFTLSEDVPYYVYYKCDKLDGNGNIIISTSHQEVESLPGYYLFPGGFISSIFENARVPNFLNGLTMIAGGNITTGRIQDTDARLVIDLSANPPTITARNGAKFIGNFSFESASGLENIEGIDDMNNNIADAQTSANKAIQDAKNVNDYMQMLESGIDSDIIAINKRLDGVVENYFEMYDPTLDNYPASEWVTSKDKENHNGDTFTNRSTGNSWKWKIVDGLWGWDEITDTIEKELLNKIAAAQDTADGKRRNFVFTPYPPYDVGDTWSQGVGGDMLRCIKSRQNGVFDISDWDKASKYTDDTAANEAKSRLEKMSEDGLLSKEEKPMVRQQWAQIQKEHINSQADAVQYNVSIDDLQSAYDALALYLVEIGIDSDEDSEIVPDVFNQMFADYSAERYRFSNTIADKIAQEKADGVQEGVDELNYLKAAIGHGSVEIDNGLVLGNVLAVSDPDTGQIVAGVSGIPGDSVYYWSGSNYANRTRAPFRVTRLGEIFGTNGKLGIFEINGKSVFVNAADDNKIWFMTDKITSVSQAIALGSSGAPSTRRTEEVSVIASPGNPYITDSSSTSQFSCDAGVLLSFQVNGQASADATSNAAIDISIINVNSGKEITLISASGVINQSVSHTISEQGTYIIRATAWALRSSGITSYARSNVNAITYNFASSARKTIIAPNGVAVVQSTNKYQILTGDICEMVLGKGGFRINQLTGSLEKTVDGGSTWISL